MMVIHVSVYVVLCLLILLLCFWLVLIHFALYTILSYLNWWSFWLVSLLYNQKSVTLSEHESSLNLNSYMFIRLIWSSHMMVTVGSTTYCFPSSLPLFFSSFCAHALFDRASLLCSLSIRQLCIIISPSLCFSPTAFPFLLRSALLLLG